MMNGKKYTLSQLSNYNKTYNQLIKILKKTIPQENCPEIMQKFEDRAFEDDDRSTGLKWMMNMNGCATIATASLAMLGAEGALGALLATGSYTIVYYLWCKHVMQLAKSNKEECLKFLQTVSENQNNIRYPFTIGNDEDLEKLKTYVKAMSGKNRDSMIDYFNNLSTDNEEYIK